MGRKVRRKNALFVTSRNVHRLIAKPVIDELKERDWDIRLLRFERIWERVEWFLSRTTRRRSVQSFYEEPNLSKVSERGHLAYDLLAKGIFRIVSFFRLNKPSIIIVMTDTVPLCRVAVLFGKLARIPTLLLLHSGMVGRNYDCPPFIVDRIAVTGDFAKNRLMDCGVENGKITVTGQPLYDSLLVMQKHFSRSDICRKLGIDTAKKIVVYTTENLPSNENERMARIVCRTVREISGVDFVIKVHPSELDLSLYKKVTEECILRALVTRDAPLFEILYASDVVITGFSATALDAMILDKPVIAVNLTGFKDPLPFAESGAAIGVYQESDLKEALWKGLYDEAVKEKLGKSREKFVFEHAYKRDGRAAERVAELVDQMTRNAKSE